MGPRLGGFLENARRVVEEGGGVESRAGEGEERFGPAGRAPGSAASWGRSDRLPTREHWPRLVNGRAACARAALLAGLLTLGYTSQM